MAEPEDMESAETRKTETERISKLRAKRDAWMDRARKAESGLKILQKENEGLVQTVADLRTQLAEHEGLPAEFLPPHMEPSDLYIAAINMKVWLSEVFGYTPGLMLGQFDDFLRKFLPSQKGKIRRSSARKVYSGEATKGLTPVGKIGVGQVQRFENALTCLDMLETIVWHHEHGDGMMEDKQQSNVSE